MYREREVRKVSVAERESKLWTASKQYMLGEISLNQLEDVEYRYALSPDTSTFTSKHLTNYSDEAKKRSAFDHIKEFLSSIW